MADSSYTSGIYTEQGGNRQVVKSGASLDIESGGEIDVESGGALKLAGVALTATAAEVNLTDNMPASVTFAAAAGGANVCEVTVTVADAAGTAIAKAFPLILWLSDAATGAALTGTSASGTVQAKSASGADFAALTAKKALIAQTLATGIYILEITDTEKTAFYVCAQCPSTGHPFISTQLATGNYGA